MAESEGKIVNKKLKPCPFCGGEAIVRSYSVDNDKYSIVTCIKCDVETPMYEFRSDAIKAWNRRADNERD